MNTLTTPRPEGAHIGVWVDKDLDSGTDLPGLSCPEVFGLDEKIQTCTHIGGVILGDYINGMVVVSPELEERVVWAALEQPEENIYLEYVRTDENGTITDW